MMDRQPSDHDGPEDSPSKPAHCALLDEYWDDLQRRSELDSRRWLIDRDVSDEAIAKDLDILNALHRSRCATRADGDGSRAAIAGAPEPEGRAEDDRSGPTVVMPVEEDPSARAEPTQRIGKYMVIERLDSGGQGQVFRVVHPALGKELVLKLARRPIAAGIEGRADAAGRDRTIGEGRLLARFDHPNLVRIFDLDIHEGRPFLVMEYVPGLTLEQFADQRRPSPRQSARLVAALAQAVAYLHDRGIVHQDIKPRNILVDDRGRPRLIDFGLARQRHAWSDDAADWSGGTAAYMSPEQAVGRADQIGPRTDVFGLGGLLYHLLTGRPLYRGASRVSILRQALNGEYLPVRQVNRRVPRALERICHKALAPDPERRHRTAVELERDLRRFLARRRVAAAGLVLASLLAVALAAPFLSGGPPPKIVSFVVDQSRGDPPHPFGPIGLSAQPVFVDDDVRVSARLDAPAYCYLIALDPDGKVEPCWPPGGDAPPRSSGIRFPPGEKDFFGLTDGPGVQAFVLVAARRALPPHGLWRGSDGLRRRWKPAVADGTWGYDGRGFTLVSRVSRGEVRERSGAAPPAPFREVCEYLEKLDEVEAVQALAFPVRPKAGEPPPVQPRSDAP